MFGSTMRARAPPAKPIFGAPAPGTKMADSVYGRTEALFRAISFVAASLALVSEPVNIGNFYI